MNDQWRPALERIYESSVKQTSNKDIKAILLTASSVSAMHAQQVQQIDVGRDAPETDHRVE